MATHRYRSAYVFPVVGALALALLPTAAAASSDSDVHASMQCDRAAEPGRVRCAVDLRIEGGRTIAWADVEIVALPEFASALKGRIGPQDALSRDADSMKWALGLVARRGGSGEARARVRVVACDGREKTKCVPVIVEVRAVVSVG